MALFGLGKKKDETKSSCCCGGTCTPETMEKAEEKKNSMGGVSFERKENCPSKDAGFVRS